MNRLVVAFDVDDTLIVPAVATGFDRDVPNYDTIAVYRWFQAHGHIMVVWSGGGEDYARMWGEKLGLNADVYRDKHDRAAFTFAYAPFEKAAPDIAVDDSDLTLATVNVKVGRVNNRVVRYPERARGTGDEPPSRAEKEGRA